MINFLFAFAKSFLTSFGLMLLAIIFSFSFSGVMAFYDNVLVFESAAICSFVYTVVKHAFMLFQFIRDNAE